MDILTYVKGVPTFKKGELVNKLTAQVVIANDLLANLERMAANKIDLEPETNKWGLTKSLIRSFDNDGYRGISFNVIVKKSLETIVGLSNSLIKVVQSSRMEVWDGKILNLRQANMLNLIEHNEHWLKYTNMLYDVLITMRNKAGTDPDRYLLKADLRFLNQTVEYYKGTTSQLLKGVKVIMNELEAIPEVEVTETSLAVLEGVDGDGSTSLSKQGFGIHQVNPVFWYKLGRMNLNLARIEKARRDNEVFAMKISQTVNQRNGENDAELDHRIEVYQDEIIKNVALIEHIEKEYA